jgi:selenocysteine-specific elongation factor
VRELLRVAVAEGRVVGVSEELYFDAGALAGLKERLVAYLRDKSDISTQAFKELVGQSRKFVIPLSEYFDREKVTLRVGEKRVLRRA